MKEIKLSAKTLEETVRQIQDHIGGEISERWGEYVLDIDNDIAKGCFKFLSFDLGFGMLDVNIITFEDILFISDSSKSNPIHFLYCSKGYIEHRFENQKTFTKLKEFHSCILTSKKGMKQYAIYPKGIHIELNNIRLRRNVFLNNTSLNYAKLLNERLYEVFSDREHEQEFSYYGSIDLKMADHVKNIHNNSAEGIKRIFKIEAEIFQLLAMHIEQHDKLHQTTLAPLSLTQSELLKVRKHAKKIVAEPSFNYSLNQISRDSGLSQAKLQEGFKFLYARTVTEFIRHTRLEAARDMMTNTDLNISQIVYSIGFTSRSYFSKIFKERFNITPHQYKKQVVVPLDIK